MLFLRYFLSLILLVTLSSEVYSQDNWELLYQPRQRVVKSIAVFNDIIFAGTGNGVFFSNDEGKTWQDFGSSQLEKDSNGNSLINWISTDKKNKKIFIATSFGAYFSDIEKPDWQKIFEGAKIESSEVNSLTINSNKAYLATDDGFWVCSLFNNEFNCKKIIHAIEADPISSNAEINYVLENDSEILVSASTGVYLFDVDLSTGKKISNEIQTLPDGRINANHLYIDSEENLYLACGTGVYLCRKYLEKDDFEWERISNGIGYNNEGFQEAFYFFEAGDTLYLGSASGVYFFDKKNNLWKETTGGIRTRDGNKNVYFLTSYNDQLYAATDEGLFVVYTLQKANHELQTTNSEIILKGKVEKDFTNLEEIEPSVIEVQKQALKFSSLPRTEDFKRYRLQARLRNLLPSVSFDINSTGTNSNFYGFENGILADKSLSNKFNANKTQNFQRDGKSFKQLSILWKTNEFLYDDEIREVLNQARLAANIKENILDDVTRIYFQRRKLQLDLLLEPPIQLSQRLTNQLEVDELTGQLDSRTGGWFSKELEKRKGKMKVITNGKV